MSAFSDMYEKPCHECGRIPIQNAFLRVSSSIVESGGGKTSSFFSLASFLGTRDLNAPVLIRPRPLQYRRHCPEAKYAWGYIEYDIPSADATNSHPTTSLGSGTTR